MGKKAVTFLLLSLLISCSTGNRLQRNKFKSEIEEGLQAYASKNYLKAEEIFSDLSDKRPDDLKVKEMLALTRQKLGKNNEAIELFEEILEVSPKRSKSLLGLSRAALAYGDTAKAVTNLEKAVAYNSDNIEAIRELAKFYSKKNNRKETLKWTQLLLDKKPDDKWAQSLLRKTLTQSRGKKTKGLDGNGLLNWKELRYLHESYGLEKVLPWNALEAGKSEGILTRRDFYHYLSSFFRKYLGRENFSQPFAGTKTGIKDLFPEDPDYSDILYFRARDLTFPIREDKIDLELQVSESEALEIMAKLKEQVAL
jgi:tetratricopeptide (TPR) repeat protein